MSSLKELVELGKELSYDGAQLAEFVKDEQARERQVRAEERQQRADEAVAEWIRR